MSVSVGYLGVAAYYDNRRAAVTVTLDDWDNGSGGYFSTALGILGNVHMPATVSIITYGLPDWSLIQNWYDTGNVEPASHTRNHACDESEYLINGYAFQIEGSRDDIRSHLNLRNPHITTFVEPCGYTDAQVRQNVVSAGYLVERGYPAAPVQGTFSPWGGDGAYARTLYSIDTTAWYLGTRPLSSFVSETNASFATAYGQGGIYHLLDHPWYGFWSAGTYLDQHVAHISNRPDVWYVPFGGLYLYHFVTERGLMNAYADGSTTPLPTNIITNPPPPIPVQPHSLWDNTVVPQSSTAGDTNPIELGIKFRSDISGYITGLRFYKDSLNTGIHYGHLWTTDGTLLAEAEFTGETTSGWQSVNLSVPVAIEANTAYVASYHTDTGNYSLSRPYFNTGYYNAPLYAFGTNESSGNGVYQYGLNRSFPNHNLGSQQLLGGCDLYYCT